MRTRIAGHNWAGTSLGPSAGWPQSLRFSVELMLTSRHPMLLWWGPELIQFYNDACVPLLGQRHPLGLGQPAASCWAETWLIIGEFAEAVMKEGVSTWSERLEMVMTRNGFPEEVYMTLSYSPILDETGAIGGLFCTYTEETQRVLGERRMAALSTLSTLGDGTAPSRNLFETEAAITSVLGRFQRDLPFTLLYRLDIAGRTATLAGHTGLAPDTLASPHRFEVGGIDAPWPVEELLARKLPLLLCDLSGAAPAFPSPWPEPVRIAMLLALPRLDTAGMAGFLVVGLSPRLVVDNGYKSFLQLVARQLARELANARAYEVISKLDLTYNHKEVPVRTSEAWLTFLLQFRDALSSLTDPSEIMRVASRLLGKHLQADRALFSEIEDEHSPHAGRILAQYIRRGALPLTGTVVYDVNANGRVAQCLQRGKPFIMADAASDAGLNEDLRRTWLAAEMHALVLVPLTRSGKAAAHFGVHQAAPREWTVAELRLIAEVAQRTWTAAERARIEAALRESEEKYRGLFNSIDQGFCTVEVLFDDEGRPIDYRFLEINAAFERQTGLKGALGVRMRDLAPAHEQYWFDTYGRIARTGIPEKFEHHAHALNHWYDVYAFRTGEASQNRVAVLFDDIKERKLRELGAAFIDQLGQELEPLSDPDEIMAAAGKRIGTFFIVSGYVLCDVDVTGKEAIVSHGWTATDVPGLRQTFLLDDYVTKEFSRAGRAGEIFIVRDTAHDPRTHANACASLMIGAFVVIPFVTDGLWKTFCAITCERPRDWHPDEIMLLKDISERLFLRVQRAHAGRALRTALKKAQQSGDELREGDVAKDRFLAVLSHELRNPLASISTAAAVLCANTAEADRTRASQVIVRQAAVMKSLLDDLLDITRLRLGRMELHRRTTGLDAVVNAAVENVNPRLDQSGHSLAIDIPAPAPLVNGDLLRLVQVIANLLTNAIKYTPSPGRLRITVSQDDTQAQVKVMDNGVGMHPRQIEQMFTMFNRGEQSGTTDLRAGEGLGIGLALARSIAQLHGGTLVGRSEGRGRGSEFVLTLPLADPAEPTETPPEENPAAEPADSPARGTVLLVDDNVDAIWAHGFLLKSVGWDVVTAASGREALELAQRHHPVAAVVDIGLPDINGHQVARQLRRTEGDRHIVLIAATGWGQPADMKAAIDAGFDLHMTKPVRIETLIKELERLTKRFS